MTGLGCIGRITYDRIKTGLTQRLIQRRAHSFSGDRGRINFPVSGVQHLAHRCANQQTVGLRRTVRDGHHLTWNGPSCISSPVDTVITGASSPFSRSFRSSTLRVKRVV